MTTTCPSPEMLADYALGQISASNMEEIAVHVDRCPACQARMDTMDGIEDTFISKLRQWLPQQAADRDPELESLIAQAQTIPLSGRAKSGVIAEAASPAATEAEPPAVLGQYMLLSRCGQGGMGTVYRAVHTRLKRPVAVKLLTAQRLADPQAVARFQREMEAVGRLSHPNIVQALDANEVEGRHFLVTEFVEGINLRELVRAGGPLLIPDACEIIHQAALGLQHAHEHGLVHRDVKPSNLMLSSQGIVKLLDLGLARLRPEVPAEGDMTASGQVMGSADYMAPEQCLDARDVDARADIYSLGCTLYFLLAGRPPFAGRRHGTAGKKLLAHVQEPVPPIRSLTPEVPAELVALLERMLAKDAALRPFPATSVGTALEPLAAGSDLQQLLKSRTSTSARERPGTTEECSSEPRLSRKSLPQRIPATVRLRWILAGLFLVTILTFVGFRYGPAVIGFLRGYKGTSAATEPADSAGTAGAIDQESGTPAVGLLSPAAASSQGTTSMPPATTAAANVPASSETILEGFPANVVRAAVQGEPREEAGMGGASTLKYDLRVDLDMDKYEAFQGKLTATLEKIATKKGEMFLVTRPESSAREKYLRKKMAEEFSREWLPDVVPMRARSRRGDDLPFCFGEVFSLRSVTDWNKGGGFGYDWWPDHASLEKTLVIVVNTARNQSHDRTTWRWYHVPRPTKAPLGLQVKVSLVDGADKEVLHDRLSFGRRSPGCTSPRRTDQYEKGMELFVSPYLLFGYMNWAYTPSVTLERSIQVKAGEVQSRKSVRCTVTSTEGEIPHGH